MTNIKRLFQSPFLFLILLILSNFIIIVQISSKPNISQNPVQESIEPQNPYFDPHDTVYKADIHWVKTNITVDSKGIGQVSMILNCTPEEDHIGIFIRTVIEVHTLNLAKCYAETAGEKLELNITSSGSFDISYYVYLKNATKAQTGVPLVYYFSYEADFFQRNQIYHYEVETDLVAINLVRPDWDDALEFETLRIQLPVTVSGTNISSSFLDEIGFTVDPLMEANYNLSYIGQLNGDDNYQLTFISSKENLPERGAFEATFYLSIDYFSLPRVLNWFVITFSLLFSLLSLSLFVVVITVRNRSIEEDQTFKEELYNVLKQDNQ